MTKAKKINNLDYTQRPSTLNNFIQHQFNSIAAATISEKNWDFNGASRYKLCGVDEYQLLQTMVTNNPQQNIFRILDIGAGRFEWVDSITKKFSQDHPNKKLIAYGLSAEKCTDIKTDFDNSSTIHLCSFKTEDVTSEFASKNLLKDLLDKTDMTVSRFVLKHMVDPIGTLQQLTTFLRPQTGILLTDSFKFSYMDSYSKEFYPYHNEALIGIKLYHLLTPSRLEGSLIYLMCPNLLHKKISHFAIQKVSAITLPLQYLDNISAQTLDLTIRSNNLYDMDLLDNMKLLTPIQTDPNYLNLIIRQDSCGSPTEINEQYIGNAQIYELLHQRDLMIIQLDGDLISSYYDLNYCEGFQLLTY